MAIIANIKAEDRKFKRTGKISKKKLLGEKDTPSLTGVMNIKNKLAKKQKRSTGTVVKPSSVKKIAGAKKETVKKTKIKKEKVPTRQESILFEREEEKEEETREESSPSPIDDEAFETTKESQ